MSNGFKTSRFGWLVLFTSVLVLAISGIASAQNEDFDQYKIRISGFWLHSSPTVSIEAAGHDGFVDFNRDLTQRLLVNSIGSSRPRTTSILLLLRSYNPAPSH